MQNTIITIVTLSLLGAAALGASLLLTAPTNMPLVPPEVPEMSEYRNDAYGLTFSYQTGSAGYVLEERTPGSNTTPLLTTITLTTQGDHERMQMSPPIGGEGPAVIAINVFANNDRQFPLAWAMEYPEYSSYNLKTSPDEEIVVGGANALAYTADGLYPARQVIAAHGSYIYVLTGQYLDPESALRADFDNLVASVQFIPKTMPTGKIDITVACESALAYTTFTDGEAAAAFVTACINGEHPEVIERYKQDQGMDAAAM